MEKRFEIPGYEVLLVSEKKPEGLVMTALCASDVHEDEDIEIKITLTPADLAALGYVGWRPASEKPDAIGIFPVVNSAGDVVGAFWDGTRWDRKTAFWLPLPPLPLPPLPEVKS
jgi:hypothetical protein